jgi:hypothetical protein
MLKLARILTMAMLVALPALGAYAQGVTGSVDILVVEPDGSPVSDASVLISEPGTGLLRQKTTDKNGKVSARLHPGDYELQISKSGFQQIEVLQMTVQVGRTEELSIPLVSGSIEEIVTYGTAAPLTHIATGESGLNISLEAVSQLPVARSIESVALMAPGTIPGIDAFGEDKTLVSFGGASVAENVYYIDGLNVSNFRNGLGGASVPFEFYDQFDIKSGGYSAEFGRSTGGVLNATTRRGGNEFEFGVVTFFEPDSLRETSPDTILDDGSIYDLNSNNSQSNTTIDIYAGGPIIQDRLFFFLLYEPQDTTATYNKRDDADRQVVEKTNEDFWGGNLSWNITDNHSLSFTAFSDQREIVGESYEYDLDAESRGNLTGTSTDFRGGDSFILNYQGDLTNNLTVALQYGKNEYDLTTSSTNDYECPPVIDVRDSSPATFPGCWLNGFAESNSDERNAYRFDVYYYIGNHEIRAGIDREENTSYSASTYSGLDFAPGRAGGVYYRLETYDVGAPLANGAIVPDANGDGSRVDTVRHQYADDGGFYDTNSQAWYIEDTWEINDQFTVQIGIRNEKFENKNADGEAFIEIDDQWAPRFALQWSPGGSNEQLVTLNYGRYHIPIAAGTNVFLGGGRYLARRYFLTDGDLDPVTGAPTALDSNGIPTGQELGSELVMADGSVPDVRGVIDHSVKPMYQDEWMLSYKRDFGDDWSAGIRFIYRDLKSTIEDVATFAGLVAIGADPGVINFNQPCAYILSNPGTSATTFCDVDGDGELEETLFTAEQLGFPEAERTYEAIELSAQKDFGGRWSLQGSYTWSKNLGNIEGLVKSDLGQDNAGTTEDFDIPQLMDGAYGYLPNDRRHKLKLWGTYQATDRLMLSGNLYFQSGRPRNAFGAQHPDGPIPYGDTYYLEQPDGSLEFSPRGSFGRTDTTTQVNLTALYRFSWGDRAEVELRADVFNLLDADNPTEVGEHLERNGYGEFGMPIAYQVPRYVRFGAAVRF